MPTLVQTHSKNRGENKLCIKDIKTLPVTATAPLSPALGDTGAGANVISKTEADRLNLNIQPLSNPILLKGCENSSLRTIGKTSIPLLLANPSTFRNNELIDSTVTYDAKFFVVENLSERIILGTPFFKSNRAKFDFHTQRLQLTPPHSDVSQTTSFTFASPSGINSIAHDTEPKSMSVYSINTHSTIVSLLSQVSIPPRSEVVASARVRGRPACLPPDQYLQLRSCTLSWHTTV